MAPFRPAPDAQVIDSTSLTPEEVVAHILQWLEGVGVVVGDRRGQGRQLGRDPGGPGDVPWIKVRSQRNADGTDNDQPHPESPGVAAVCGRFGGI